MAAAPDLAESLRTAKMSGNTITWFDRGEGPVLPLQQLAGSLGAVRSGE